MQLVYLNLVNNIAPDEKISKAEEAYLQQQKNLHKAMKDVAEKSMYIRKKEDKLADLKKDLSDKLTDREKIRLSAT
ncbi:MAG: hypothetical protein ACFFG0_31520 [Candidatus Thorarchaeota archaeon]